mgnify:CR=1 FL=1
MKNYFSIIVLSHNNRYIDIVLDAVIKQIEIEDEIIVVDDHSEKKYINRLQQTASKYNIKLLNSVKNGNRSHNRNLGVKNSHNDILLFLDGDIVLMDNALSVLRNAHVKREERAFIGHKHNIHYDQLHFQLHSGIDNYLELLQTFSGQKQLASNYFITDERESFFENNDNREFFWMHYYTGASSVERTVFEQCGGFDESFETWGSEDVDLGYRIHFISQIGFLKDFHSFHIPHKRDAFKIETTNMENILKMLKKYQSWEFEVQYSFSGNPLIHKSVYYIVNQMRTLSLSDIQLVDFNCDSYIVINTISKRNPNGNIIVKTKEKKENIQQIGLALPYSSQTFDEIYVSEHIFTYPPIITSRILQETIRVGKNVYIQKMPDCIRINWNTNALIPTPLSNYRVAYHSNDTMDFSFYEKDNIIKVLPALPQNIMRSPIFLENKYVSQHDKAD